MRKYNEGYTVVLVLVVLLMIGLIATFILTFSLNNLNNQRASIDRMQAQYEAAGEIEKIVGKLNSMIPEKTQGDGLAIQEPQSCEIAYEDIAPDLENVQVTFGEFGIDVVATVDAIQINCTLAFALDPEMSAEVVFDDESDRYTITGWIGMEYISYEISRINTQEVAGG